MNRKIFFSVTVISLGLCGILSFFLPEIRLFQLVLLAFLALISALLGYSIHQSHETTRLDRERDQVSKAELAKSTSEIAQNLKSVSGALQGVKEATAENSNRLRRLSNDQIKAFKKVGNEVQQGCQQVQANVDEVSRSGRGLEQKLQRVSSELQGMHEATAENSNRLRRLSNDQIKAFKKVGNDAERSSQDIIQRFQRVSSALQEVNQATAQNSNRLRRLSNDQAKAFDRAGREVREGFRDERDLIVNSQQSTARRQVTYFDSLRNILEEIESGELSVSSNTSNVNDIATSVGENKEALGDIRQLIQGLSKDSLALSTRISELNESTDAGIESSLRNASVLEELKAQTERSSSSSLDVLTGSLGENKEVIEEVRQLIQVLSKDSLALGTRISELNESADAGLERSLRNTSMLEDVRSQIENSNRGLKLVADSAPGINSRLDSLSERLVELRVQIDAHNAWNVSNLSTQMSNFKESVLSTIADTTLTVDKASILEPLEESFAKLENEINSRMATNNQKLFNKLQIALYEETQETEALIRLESKIQPRSVLPSLGRWAIDAKSMLQLVNVFETVKPRLVVEIGSGTSSVWLGYLAERINAQVISIEHEGSFANRTRDLIAEHSLESTVNVIHAPLTPVEIGGEEYNWYQTDFISALNEVDLLIVDGPIGSTSKHARYPALPLLAKTLSTDAVVILDDTHREDEAKIAQQWSADYSLERVDHSLSRLAVLKKQSRT
ncbi:class I SAM-dependent methyltransferase [Corynebacterium casei]|uniref:class I SAM-dependent methyltransferase n=1 Tax=Corynebacterium casei TaxID=160386 RepID=UPI003FD4502E